MDGGAAASASAASSSSSRRSSAGSNIGSLLHAATSASGSPNGSNAAGGGASGSLPALASPMMVRRASKHAISFGNNSQLQAFLQRYTVADLQAWAAKRSSSSAAERRGSSPAPGMPGASPSPTPNPAHTVPPPRVIELASTATPAEGFELLLSNNILSCPVYDAAAKAYTGFLDVCVFHMHAAMRARTFRPSVCESERSFSLLVSVPFLCAMRFSRDLVSSIIFAHDEQLLTTGAAFNDRWNELMLKVRI
jgi:hypothetical protein